jgi:hypothetical protein
MKVYVLANVSGRYMYPLNTKVYKSISGAKKALKIYKEQYPKSDAKILAANNWQEEM